MELERVTGRSFYEFIFSMLPEKSAAVPGSEAGELEAGISVLLRTKVTDMVYVLYAGLYGGSLKEKTTPLSVQEVIDLLDEEQDSLTPLVQALSMVMESLPKPVSDNGQKKR
jgi:hypothetical protein